jgi:hypothetical protein
MTNTEVQILRRTLARGQTVIFAPWSAYPKQVMSIAEDGVTIFLNDEAEGLNITTMSLSDFALSTRLQG